MEKLTIGKLADKAGVGVETVRFYQRKSLIREPERQDGGFRTYHRDDISRLVFIKKVQELGFSLAEVKELLELNTKPRATCTTVKNKTTKKIKEIEGKISDLQEMKLALEKLSCACDASHDQVKQYKVQECFGVDC